MRILFPWFPKELNPNSRTHWRKKAAFAKVYRAAWYALAIQARVPKFPGVADIELLVTFLPPDRRLRDRDNCVAGIKNGMDGLADALGVNDRRFVPTYRMSDLVMGVVEVVIHVEQESTKW